MKGYIRKIAVCIILGCAGSALLVYFGFRGTVEPDALDPGNERSLIIAAVCYAVVFSAILISAVLMRDRLTRAGREAAPVAVMEKTGIVLQAVSIVIAAASVLTGRMQVVLWVIGIILVCLGSVICFKRKSRSSVSFILWGAALCLLPTAMAMGVAV